MFRKTSKQYADSDYVSKLSESDKKWLYDFQRGYYSNNFKNSKIWNKENREGLSKADHLRRKDLMSVHTPVELDSFDIPGNSYEDALIDIIDSRKK